MNKTSFRYILLASVMMVAVSTQAQAQSCYSEGIRIGNIQKFSQKGMMSKSWEGELVMEGTKISGSSAGVRGGNVWAFSVLDSEVAKVLDEVAMTGGAVALKYCQASPLDLIKGFSTNTPYRIVKAVPRK